VGRRTSGGGHAACGRPDPCSQALVESRVRIADVRLGAVLAYVRGDSGELREVRWDPRRGWSCNLPGPRVLRNGHAVASVVVVPPRAGRFRGGVEAAMARDRVHSQTRCPVSFPMGDA
jgi:hypothetical protein